MKLLILTCLVTAALARPKHPLRHRELFQNEPDSREPLLEQLREENINELSRQRELLREKQSDELKDTRNGSTEDHGMEDPEQREFGSSSSSEEVAPNSNEKELLRLDKYNLHQLEATHDHEQLHRTNEEDHAQLPFQQFYQLDAHPYAAWYYPPQVTQYIASPSFFDIPKRIASENSGKTIMPQW
uniref:Alpha-S1-casein n=1 Tax=Phocoena sinus TaxID=42100 RepID=A0A8C9B939_PHOSS